MASKTTNNSASQVIAASTTKILGAADVPPPPLKNNGMAAVTGAGAGVTPNAAATDKSATSNKAITTTSPSSPADAEQLLPADATTAVDENVPLPPLGQSGPAAVPSPAAAAKVAPVAGANAKPATTDPAKVPASPAVAGATDNANEPVSTTLPGLKAELPIQAGIHYKVMPEKIRSKEQVRQLMANNPDKIQVLIFFNYGCSVCRGLNAPFDSWAAKQDVKTILINKLPVSFNRGWGTLAQAFYTVQGLGKSARLDEVIFSSIHEKSMPLWDVQNLENVLAENGVDRAEFKQTFNSFNVNNQTKWANDLSIAFEIAAIPNIVVTGPYGAYITNLSMTKDQVLLFRVLDFLIKKEIKNPAAAAATGVNTP